MPKQNENKVDTNYIQVLPTCKERRVQIFSNTYQIRDTLVNVQGTTMLELRTFYTKKNNVQQ